MSIPSQKLQSDIDSVRELRSSRLVSRDTFLFCSPGVPRLVAQTATRLYYWFSPAMLLWAGCRACSNSGGGEADIFALKRSLNVRQVSELAGVDLTVVAFLGI